MTTGCNIFHDKATMPTGEHDEIGDPIRTRQHTNSPKGAQVMTKISEPMSVEHVDRPRRGHDY